MVLAPGADSGGVLPQGTLTFETRVEAKSGGSLPLWSGKSGSSSKFELVWHPDGSFSLSHAHLGAQTPAGFATPGEAVQLQFSWDMANASTEIVLRNSETGDKQSLRSAQAGEVALGDVLPAETPAKSMLGYAGIASHLISSEPVSGFAAGTPVQTDFGAMLVEDLRPGMRVETLNNGLQQIRWIGKQEVLANGPMAPILLRAPYFGLTHDVLVSSSHRVLLSGPDVEYLTGHEQVFSRAIDMVNGVSARRYIGMPTQTYHHFLLDDHDCIEIGRCRLESLLLADLLRSQGRSGEGLDKADRLPFAPEIDRAATQALQALMAEHRRSAA